MTQETTYYPIQEKLDLIDPLFEDIDSICKEYNPETNILFELLLKKQAISEGKINGVIGIQNEKATNIAWIELLQPHYGNILLHSLDKSEYQSLVHNIISAIPISNAVLELIQFIPGFEYRDLLCQHGFLEKERHRMIYDIPDSISEPSFNDNITFEQLSMDTIDIVGELSFQSHSIRTKIEGYYDFSSKESRSEMERILRTEETGKNIDEASLLMRINGTPVGICDVMELQGWGYDKIGWIMDISIHPDFQGMGYGRLLLNKVIYETKQQNIDSIGLGVTLSNKVAVNLYKSYGFREIELFVEFIFQ